MALVEFLEVGQQSAGRAGRGMPPPNYTAPPANFRALPSPGVPTDGGRDNSSGEIMGIQIPDGVRGGQLICVVTPDGRPMQVTVPRTKSGGEYMELWYDAQRGNLSPMV